MENATRGGLSALSFFPTHNLPKDRRLELKLALAERRAAIGNAFSNGAVLALSVIFCLFYSGICLVAWINQAHMAFDVLFSILSAATFISSMRCAQTFRQQLDRVPVLPKKLVHMAGAEAALERAAADLNIRTIHWNEAAKAAQENDVGEAIKRGLASQRAAIERQQHKIHDNLRRFCASADS